MNRFSLILLALFSICTIQAQTGLSCDTAIPITLPFNVIDNTANYGDTNDLWNSGMCNVSDPDINFNAGNDVFYSWTATFTGSVSIRLASVLSAGVSIFVYDSCANVGISCVAGIANTNNNLRRFSFNAVSGVTYIISISSHLPGQKIYNLLIEQEICPALVSPLFHWGATNVYLHWNNDPQSTSWEVAVQAPNSLVPTLTSTVQYPNVTQQGLQASTDYELWIRSACPGGGQSPWAVRPFRTDICDSEQKCAYIFKLKDTGNNGWQGNSMELRQNDVVMGTIGPEFISGGESTAVVYLCSGIPFELFWMPGGVGPHQVGVEVVNPFGQTIYSKPPGSGTRNTPIYDGDANCGGPICNIPPTNVSASNISASGFTINWDSPAIMAWDIYIALAGSPAPSAGTIPTYNNVVMSGQENPSFTTTIPLDPDTDYDIYVRNVCEYPTAWTAGSASTHPLCFKPVNLSVINATLTSAEVLWENGMTTDTAWEILLVPGPDLPAAPYVPVEQDGILYQVDSPSPFTITGLDPATIYFYYIRTNCGEKSRWAGPLMFNTVTCTPDEQCLYKFILTDTEGNGWNGGKMQVRQNGIFVYELLMTAGSTVTRNVPLCTGVPFDVIWTIAGSQPQQIGLSIQNPFLDVLYTYSPGPGAEGSVIYSGMTNCTDSPCAKPTNILISDLTAGSATAYWTDSSIPPSDAFDLYLMEAGGTPPGNNPSATPTHALVSPPFLLTGLSPSTSYKLYVRAVCSDAVSTWPDLWPATFSTPPLNDECISAELITVNEDQTCLPANSVSGNTLGATASMPVLDPPLVGTGCLVNNRDVWYKFIASGTSHAIDITNMAVTPASAATTFRLNFSVFSGSCESLTKIQCYTDTRGVLTALTPGETYYIRVYPSTSNVAQSASFNICILSPPSNDDCAAAIVVPVNPGMVSTSSVSGNTLGASDSGLTTTGPNCGTSDDDIWFKFVASASAHILAFTDLQTHGNAILNHSVFTGSCDSPVLIGCSNLTNRFISGLVPGQTYYIRVYTNFTLASNSIAFNLAIKTPPPVVNDECTTAIPLIVGTDGSCSNSYGTVTSATASSGDNTCAGVEDDDVWYTFTALSTSQIILLDGITVGLTLNSALYSGACGALTLIKCGSHTLAVDELTIGEVYFLRIWSNANVPVELNFNVCVKTASSCQDAQPFCGSGPDDPYMFPNVTNEANVLQVACLGSIPNPAYYTLLVEESGTLIYNIQQYDSFDTYGVPQGMGRDVDFVAWGPFSSTQSCDLIEMTDCINCPPNNTTNPDFYPYGNIVDCSYSPAPTETLTIANAQAGEYYIVLVTNFSNQPGKIKLTQTNFAQPGAGTTYCADKIQMIAFIDANNNGIKDIGEQNFTLGQFSYQKNNTGPVITVSGPRGTYSLYDDTAIDSFDISYSIYPEYLAYFNAIPTAFNDLTIPAGSGTQTLYFPIITALETFNDLSVNISHSMAPRPGISYTNKVTYKNLGLSYVSATLNFTKDPAVNISVSSPNAVMNSNGFTLNIVNLAPMQTVILNVITTVPNIPAVSIGDQLQFTASISMNEVDDHPVNNVFTSTQTIIGAYDPNDKSEAHGDKVDITTFTADDYLYYTIRFQNTGTYNAFDVRVEDFLDSKLDETSIRMEDASHNYAMQRIGNHVIWTFSDIFLPSIVQDEPASHGYINFRIKLKPGFVLGDIVENDAAIYFDTNPPIITNTVMTEVMTTLGTPTFTATDIMLYPNPAATTVSVTLVNSTEVLGSVALYDVVGKCIFKSPKLASNETNIDVSALSKGVYMVEVITGSNARQTKKLIVR